MKCPACQSLNGRVLESRLVQGNEVTRRRRVCNDCENRFTTYEHIEEKPIMVIKKDRTKELFDGRKILKGLVRAFEKRPVDAQQLENLVSDLEREIKEQKANEIKSDELGRRILDKLQGMDQVAYIRFASVYRKFENASEFINEVNQILLHN